MSPEEEPPDVPDVPSIEKREERAGAKLGDRYVRIVRPAAQEFRHVRGHLVATELALNHRGPVGEAVEKVTRVLVGRRLGAEAEAGERVPVATGLAILASDNLSSSAYATEEAMRVLALAGVGALALTMPIALAVVFVLGIVVLSESRVIRAYPNGGGSYLVARENHGDIAGLTAASALLIDYVLTVAVSTAAGVLAISSFVPALHEFRVPVGLGAIGLLALANLRGVREAGLVFAAPTYAYIAAMVGLLGFGIFRVLSGDVPPRVQPVEAFGEPTQALMALLVLRAFASGSVGLTGSEAVANGVPSFRPPEARNAVITLVLMGSIFATIFLGLTYLATVIGIEPDASELETVNSMITRSVVGAGTPFYYVVQITTAIILLLAANTGFTGFPRLASVLANDRFMPRHFADIGSRLAFNTGIVSLALIAGVILMAFGGSVTALVPLYTIGVFLAFTLSQSGLVRRWYRLRNKGWRLSMAINTLGTIVTFTVLVIVSVTKFLLGAWMVVIALPLLVALLHAIHRHYRDVQDALTLETVDQRVPHLQPPVVLVPVARIDLAALRAVAFARSMSRSVKAVHVSTSRVSGDEFQSRWQRFAPDVPLDVIESPYRSLVPPLLRYINAIEKASDRPLTVVISEFVARHWWERFLHSQTAGRIKSALLFRPDTIVIDVPYHFREVAATQPQGVAPGGSGVPPGGSGVPPGGSEVPPGGSKEN